MSVQQDTGELVPVDVAEMSHMEATTRAYVVDELRELGLISEKKARKRLMKLAKVLPSVGEGELAPVAEEDYKDLGVG